jgi:hypothetical protein
MTTYEHWSDDPELSAEYFRSHEEWQDDVRKAHQEIARRLRVQDWFRQQLNEAHDRTSRYLKDNAYARDVFSSFYQAYRTRGDGIVRAADWEEYTSHGCHPPSPARAALRLVVSNKPQVARTENNTPVASPSPSR